MLKIERGVSYPLIIRKDKEERKEEGSDEDENDPAIEPVTEGNMHEFKSFRVYFPVKLWPNKDFYELWSNYI